MTNLPDGYTLDLASDPDAPVLRRRDGVEIARFSAGGMTPQAVEEAAWQDLLLGSRQQSDLHPLPDPGRDRSS